MYFTMVMLGFLYAVFALFLLASGTPLIFIGGIVGVMLVVQYYMSDRLILMSTGAKQVSAEQEPALHRMIQTLADRYEMPMPKVAVIDTAIPNAFATGRNPKNALVAVTTGIQQRLSERELQAVIGHELAHTFGSGEFHVSPIAELRHKWRIIERVCTKSRRAHRIGQQKGLYFLEQGHDG